MPKIRKRHVMWNKILSPAITKIIKKKFNYTFETCDIKPPFVVLGNHATDYDAFFVSKSFKNHIYFVMSDHITTIPVAGKLINYLVSPIPMTKSAKDFSAVREILSVIKQGGAVGIFPEGNKSFSGGMSAMKFSIAKLLKKIKIPVVLHVTEGGYFSSPRWTKEKRKGKIHGSIKRIITPEEIEKLTAEDLFELIKTELHVNAYEVQEKNKTRYNCPAPAKNIESLLYVCPNCKEIDSLKSKETTFHCTKCGTVFGFDEFGCVHNAFTNRLDELDIFQKDYIKNFDWNSFDENEIITQDSNWTIWKKINNYKSNKVGVFSSTLYKDRLVLENEKEKIEIKVKDIIGSAIEGVNGIQIFLSNRIVYRFKNNLNVNGLKYLNLISALNNTTMRF